MSTTEKWASLVPFNGKDPSFASEWLDKFELMRIRKEWKEVDTLYYFKHEMTAAAYIWLKSLDDDTKATYVTLKQRFERDWVSSEPKIVLERKLENRKLQIDKCESIESYRAAISELGSKVGRTGDMLTSDFLRGLPQYIRDYCLASDIHTMESYAKRAKLCLAWNAGGTEETQAAVVNALNNMQVRQSRSPQRHGRDERSKHSKTSDVCFECSGTGHYARLCPQKKSASKDRSFKCHKCSGVGHFARVCPSKRGNERSPSYKRDAPRNGSSPKPHKKIECYVCGKSHHAKDCPDRYRKKSNDDSKE